MGLVRLTYHPLIRMKPRDVVAFVFALGGVKPDPFSLLVLGVPVFERTIRALRGGGIERILLVTDIPRLRAEAERGSIEVLAPDAGVIERLDRAKAVLGAAGDLPLLRPGSIMALIDRFDPLEGTILCGGPLFLSRGDAPLVDALTAALNDPPFRFESIVERYEAAGGEGKAVSIVPSDEALRPSGLRDLPRIVSIARRRRIDSLLEGGVSIVDPGRIYVDEDALVEAGTVLFPGVHLRGATRIGPDCTIGPDAFIEDSMIEEGSVLRYSVVEGARVRRGSSIGPYAHLRPGADVGPEARVGNFVEVKAARLGRGVKAGHLAYIGDAEVGEGANIGAGTITCNYDGVRKNRTVIEEGAFIGSNASLVAPVRIGKGAIVAAGSTITDDVPPNRLAFGRARQVVKERRRRKDDREEA